LSILISQYPNAMHLKASFDKLMIFDSKSSLIVCYCSLLLARSLRFCIPPSVKAVLQRFIISSGAPLIKIYNELSLSEVWIAQAEYLSSEENGRVALTDPILF
jgi:hypothetical protein